MTINTQRSFATNLALVIGVIGSFSCSDSSDEATAPDEGIGEADFALHSCTGSMLPDRVETTAPGCGSIRHISGGDQYDDNGSSCTAWIIEYQYNPDTGIYIAQPVIEHDVNSQTECEALHLKYQKWTYNGSWAKNGEAAQHGVWGGSSCTFSFDTGDSDPAFGAGTKWRYYVQGWEVNTYLGTSYNDFKRVAVVVQHTC
jgi:hypothetical protein